MAGMNLNRLAFFTSVVEAGSFTAAGVRLGVAKAVVSHQVAALERELGTALLVRTTRKLRLTEAGRRFYERTVAILGAVDEAVGLVKRGQEVPEGTLRLNAPHEYGVRVVAPAIARYVTQYPDVEVVLSLDDRRTDLVEANVDLSIRVGWLDDMAARARRIADFDQLLVVAPAYLERQEVPGGPAGLRRQRWIANTALRNPLRWTFNRGGERVRVVGQAAVAADKTSAVAALALSGAGLAVLPDFVVGDALAEGRLVHLLPDWSLPRGGVHVVFPPTRFRPAKVDAFVTILTSEAQRRARSQVGVSGATRGRGDRAAGSTRDRRRAG